MNDKLKLALPFPFFAVFFFLYGLLDGAVFVKVFGCSCPVETIDASGAAILTRRIFNANDLRWVVYGLLTVGMTALSVWLSKSVADRRKRILYCAVVWAFYGCLSLFVCKTMMWR